MRHIIQFKTQLFIFFTTFALLFHAFIRGYNPQDEGWVLYGGMRILNGALPYLDFQYLYTPLSALLSAFSFSIFGESILSERILALIFASITSVFLFNIFSILRIKPIISILMLATFATWGPLFTNYLSPAIIAIELSIMYIYFLIRTFNSPKSKSNNIYLFLAGCIASLVLLTKQNFGASILLHEIIVAIYLFKVGSKRKIMFLLRGTLFILGVFSLYLILSNSIRPFFHEMYSFLILDAIISDGFKYQTPFSFPAPLLYKTAKIALYTAPIVTSFMALFFALRNKSQLVLIPIFLIFIYLAGIQPVMDTIHLSPLIALSVINLGLITSFTKTTRSKRIIYGILLVLFFVGGYSGIFRSYFKWFAPLYVSNTVLDSPRAKILLEKNDARTINQTIEYISSHTQKNDYFFNYGMTPLFYFLADRISPSRFNTIETRNVQGQNLEILLQDLIINKPSLIVADGPFVEINPRIESFILKNYTFDTTIGGRLIFKTKHNTKAK